MGGWLESGGGERRRSEEVGCGNFFMGCCCCSVETGGVGERGCIACGRSADIVRVDVIDVDKNECCQRVERREKLGKRVKSRLSI